MARDEIQNFNLQDFFPYLVRVFYSDVTSVLSSTYQSEFDLTPAEWRSMAILGVNESLTSNEIVERSSMDKVTVSRAVARMKQKGLIKMSTNIADGRTKIVSLSKSGIAIYLDIVPKVLEVEKSLLSGITESQKTQFLRTMKKISENAENYNS